MCLLQGPHRKGTVQYLSCVFFHSGHRLRRWRERQRRRGRHSRQRRQREVLSGQLPQLRASSAGAVSDGGADTRCRRRLPTFLAFLRFLSGVGLLMFQEIRAAVEGLFSRVNSLVFSDVRAVPKRLPTPVTLAGLLSGVDALVANVICLVLKEASAFATLIGFLSLKRNESGNCVTVTFKRSIEGVEETLLIFRTRVGVPSALWSRSGAPAGPPAPAPPLLLSDVLLHVCVFFWAVSSFFGLWAPPSFSVPRRGRTTGSQSGPRSKARLQFSGPEFLSL